MHLHWLSIILVTIPLHVFLQNYHTPTVAAYSSLPLHYGPSEDITVSCGTSGNSTALDGRRWTGDTGSKLMFWIRSSRKGDSINSRAIDHHQQQPSLSADPVPYATARIFTAQFTYTFQVTPGQKFVRLHFNAASYMGGFERSKAFFTVKAGSYTLLSNFSASLAADALGLNSFVREFCVNIEENQPLLRITFSPSTEASYAFANGIEIVSMPAGLYNSLDADSVAGALVGSSEKYRFHIDKSIALEKVLRLNVGGSTIPSVEDTAGMFREWLEDSNYLLESSVNPVRSTMTQIKYTTKNLIYAAPRTLYQTSWSMVLDKQANKTFNFTWRFPADLGFRYLVRFHFSDLEYDIAEGGPNEFSIFLNNQMVEENANLIKWSGANGVAVLYRDYVVTMVGDRMEGKRSLLVTVLYLLHKRHIYEGTEGGIDTMVKGLEVFKLSNPDNNLAGANPEPLADAATLGCPDRQKLVFAKGGNAIGTVVVILFTILNVIVYQLRIWGEEIREANVSSTSRSEGSCRCFSLAEVLLATNNFDEQLVVGIGGFGKVYKGIIDGGMTTVAIKRLNSKSKQGAGEFWTEIEMLPKLRHSHLVSLIGYCNAYLEMILVYEYMENGTLAEHLYKTTRNDNGDISPLSWEQRINICIGAARGLDYLHTGTKHSIIHRDVKTTNILLDEDWVAKVSDFGLCKMGTASHSRRTHISTNVKGTFGYLDPVYFYTRRLTKKSDVYAFGVVLLEVLCGRPAVDTRLHDEQHSLALWAQHCIQEGKLDDIVDPSLRGQISSDCLKEFAEIAYRCLNNIDHKARPTMADVVVSLERSFVLPQVPCMESSSPQEVSSSDDDDDDDASTEGTSVASPTTLHQHDENIAQNTKRSKGMLWKVFHRSIAALGKSMDIQGRIQARKNHSFAVQNLIAAEKDLEAYLGQLKRFSLRELQVASDNFSNKNIVGRGGFGKVYKGRLADGSLVAVKRMKEERTPGGELQFQTEVEMITMAVHRNLLRLRGFCMTPTERLLVFPYMANGTVASCLRDRPESQAPLDWLIRKRIALGSARGLAWLHEDCDPKIIHRDFKAANIWLDEEFEAFVGDFGLAKLMDCEDTHVTTAVRGTIGHIAPEYLSTGKASEKTDVFGYGVMLLELITGQRAFDLARLANDNDVLLLDWVKGLLEEKELEMIVDPDMQDNYVEKEVEKLIQVALLCTQDSPWERPKMSEVVRMLESDGLAEVFSLFSQEAEEVFSQEYLDIFIYADDTSDLRPDELSSDSALRPDDPCSL